MRFSGWVPTVVGHLSFSSIGESIYPSRSLKVMVGRQLVFLQVRDLLDFVAPMRAETPLGNFFQEFIANHVVGVSGKFAFVFSGDISDDRESLSGTIFMVPVKNSSRKIKEISDTIKIRNEDLSENADGEIELPDISGNSCAKAEFSLSRTGRLDLKVECLNESQSTDEEVLEVIANQFFYFVKDNSHVHQHHDPTHDAITSVSCTDAENTWAKDTQYALYRAVIRYKRYRSEKALFRASGILAYTKSFELCAERECIELNDFHTSDLEKSLSVSRDEVKHFDEKRSQFIEALHSFFVAAFGMIISVALVLKLDSSFSITFEDSSKALAEAALTHPLLLLSMIAISSFGYAFATHRVEPAQWHITRSVLRLLQGFRLRWFVLFNAFLTIILAILTYCLLLLLT